MDVELPDGDAEALLLRRCRVLAGLRVVALDKGDAVRPEVALNGA